MQFQIAEISPVFAESLPEDDVDRAFQKLQPLELPENMVKQIMARIKRLPASQRYPQNVGEQNEAARPEEPQDGTASSL
jgi:hypothetical protein